MLGEPALDALLAVLAVGLVALGQLVLARRWDGLPLLVWIAAVAVAVAPPVSPPSWGGWVAVGVCLVGALVRRPRWLGRADVLAWSVLLSGGLLAARALGLPGLACLSVGAVGAIGLAAATVDRRGPPWRTRWVGEIPVRERS